MIISFRHKGLRAFWETGSTKGIPTDQANKIDERLSVINAAKKIEDINLPGYHLHKLQGQRKGTWSVKVTGNYRITFNFINGDAYNLDYEDYH